MQDLGVSGIQVTGVVRVENRVLYNQFTDRLKTLLEKEPLASSSSYKKLLNYLFLIWKPGYLLSISSSEVLFFKVNPSFQG